MNQVRLTRAKGRHQARNHPPAAVQTNPCGNVRRSRSQNASTEAEHSARSDDNVIELVSVCGHGRSLGLGEQGTGRGGTITPPDATQATKRSGQQRPSPAIQAPNTTTAAWNLTATDVRAGYFSNCSSNLQATGLVRASDD